MDPLIPPQINAALQIAILVILSASMGFKRKKKYRQHGALTLIATVLNLFSFLLVMLPSALGKEIVQTQPFHAVSVAILSHSVVGAVTVLLSVWLVAAWRLRSETKDCFKRKNLMRATIALWMLSLVLGFLVYAYLYTTLIP
ncbi:MAG: DUF420 domain-containing protein [Candidatus Bathyarchaeota archaeon]|nr:DUF420 domain-containing protein [Candidatus Bathyarchaeota archaeon]